MRTAVLKANYVKKGSKGASRRMRASADYYAKDKDVDGSPIGELEGFTKDADDLGRDEARAWLDEHYDPESEHGYRLMMSPGAMMDEHELREWTRDNMAQLEEERGHGIDYLAYVHNDEEHPHVHVMFAEETTLRKHELKSCRDDATERVGYLESYMRMFESNNYHTQALSHAAKQALGLTDERMDKLEEKWFEEQAVEEGREMGARELEKNTNPLLDAQDQSTDPTQKAIELKDADPFLSFGWGD